MTTQNSWNSEDPAQVLRGGTGNASFDTFEVLASGTTTVNPLQSIDSGNSGQVLTSNGVGVLPSFQDSTSGGGGSFVFLDSQTASTSASIIFDNTFITSTFNNYFISLDGVVPVTNGARLEMDISIDNGSTWLSSGFVSVSKTLATGVGTLNNTVNFVISQGVGDNGIVNTALLGYTGEVNLYNLTSGGTPRINGTGFYVRVLSTDSVISTFGGVGPATTTVNAIRFILSSGNISTGEINLYGVKTS